MLSSVAAHHLVAGGCGPSLSLLPIVKDHANLTHLQSGACLCQSLDETGLAEVGVTEIGEGLLSGRTWLQLLGLCPSAYHVQISEVRVGLSVMERIVLEMSEMISSMRRHRWMKLQGTQRRSQS